MKYKIKNSPFKYGTTVSSRAFTNREEEMAKLYANLSQGINTTIISPRRWGKSSLVEKVVHDINKNEAQIKTIIIDLFTISSEEEFLEVFAREVIKASSTKWQDWMQTGKRFFKQLIPKLSVGIDPDTDFSISFDWSEMAKHKDEILNLPQGIAKNQNIKFVICLDEFQNLATFTSYDLLEKRMRANWQRHKNVCYCLYGSKRHMMTEIFNNSSKPFYRFGDIILLPKIKTEKWVSFITKSFKNTDKIISVDDAIKIPQLMKNHSWYVQQLAHYTWQKTNKQASITEISSALNELINANSPLYQREVEGISSTQLNLLKAVVNNEHQFTSSAVMQKYKLGTPRNVSKNKSILINNDVIHEVEHGFDILDPAFELWFMKQFYKKDYL